MNKAKQQAIGTMAALLLAAVFLLAGGALALPAPKRPAQGMPADWWRQAQGEIRGLEYRPKVVPAGEPAGAIHTVRAPNRAHNFRLSFTPEGVRVTPRTPNGPDWSWGLQLTGIGRAGDLRRPEAARLRVDGERVELVRGRLTEWYINDERGLEQGFTLHKPLSGSAGDELLLRLDVAGTLQPSLEQGNRAIAFAPPGGATVLRYGQLLAFDAAGRDLPVRFDLVGGGLEIAVATTGARYPIVIDPLATSVTWTAVGDREAAYFGTSVAGAGDVNGDGYDDVIVGAPGYDNGLGGEGAVFVYHGSAAGLSATANWSTVADKANAALGASVATAGDVNGNGVDDIIIGAPGYENGGLNAGAVFLYFGSDSGLSAKPSSVTGPSLQPDWQVVFSQPGANFGTSVATAGDVDGDGNDDVIVGAPEYTSDPINQDSEGAAFVYHGSDIKKNTTAPAWDVESDHPNFVFGTSVATAGDVDADGYADVIIGVPGYDGGQYGGQEQNKEGAAFVYHGSIVGLTTLNWTVESNQTGASLGWSVATAGDVNGDGYDDVIVGAPWYDKDGNDECGAAFVYHGSPSGLKNEANWHGESNQKGSYFGISVSTACDVNNDGYADIIVGADYYDNDQTNTGAVFVYHGSTSGLRPTTSWTEESTQENSYFGASVAAAGDVNKDGFSDVVIGAPSFDTTANNESGAAFLYHGGPEGSFYLIPNPGGGATTIYLD